MGNHLSLICDPINLHINNFTDITFIFFIGRCAVFADLWQNNHNYTNENQNAKERF